MLGQKFEGVLCKKQGRKEWKYTMFSKYQFVNFFKKRNLDIKTQGLKRDRQREEREGEGDWLEDSWLQKDHLNKTP